MSLCKRLFDSLKNQINDDSELDLIINFILVLQGYRTALYYQAFSKDSIKIKKIFESESKNYANIDFYPMNNNRFIISNKNYFDKYAVEKIIETEGENGIGKILGMQCYKIYPIPIECDKYTITYFAIYNNQKIDIFTEVCSDSTYSKTKIKQDIENFNKLGFLKFDYSIDYEISDKQLFIFVYKNEMIDKYQYEIENLIYNIEGILFLKNFNFNKKSKNYNQYLAIFMIYCIFSLYKYNDKEYYKNNIDYIALALNPNKLKYEKTEKFNNQFILDILNEKFNNIKIDIYNKIYNFGYKKFSALLKNATNLEIYSAGIKYCIITNFYKINIPEKYLPYIDDYITGYYEQLSFPLSNELLNELYSI